ncbi:MAG: capsule biosynthesis protein CapK [Bacteroidota bacterium]
MIVATRSNGIYSSPRIEKYIDFYEDNHMEYLIVGWDRNNKKLIRNDTIFYTKKSGHNVGGFKAAFDRVHWMLFLFKILFKNRKKINTIHAFDLDTAFPAILFKLIIRKNIVVIFDVCDWFSATLYKQNKIIIQIFKLMERLTIKYADEVIICEPERIEQIPYKLNKEEIIVPNIPSFKDLSFLKINDEYKFMNGKITLSYVGGFGAERFLDELFDIAEKGLINLLIAGYGDAKMEQRCGQLNNLDNVKYFGKVDYQLGLNIMYNSDLIYAMYCKSNPNHVYAAPNKYYEAMMLHKPILSNLGISISNKILNQQIGYVINESLPELEELVLSLKKEEMSQKGENAGRLWDNHYRTYTSDFLNTTYQRILNQK